MADAPLRIGRWSDATALLADPPALRARATEDGYLLLRGLLPPTAVLEVRGAVLALCQEAGWVTPEGRWTGAGPFIEGQPEFMAVYDRIQRLQAFHRLARTPRLLALYEALFGRPVLAHPRNIARVMFPCNNAQATPAHQDALHIRGTAQTWTAWLPLGDCPADLGGIALMPGSHREAVLPTQPAAGAGGRAVAAGELPYGWVGGDLHAGDVLTFHSHTVHRALPNRTRSRMRLSVDYRYQPVDEPVAPDSLQPHFGRLTWEEIYAGWRDAAEDRHYWRRLPLRLDSGAAAGVAPMA